MTKRQAWINPTDYEHATNALKLLQRITGQRAKVDISADATCINIQVINTSKCVEALEKLRHYFAATGVKHEFYTSQDKTVGASRTFNGVEVQGKFGFNILNDVELHSKKDKVRFHEF
jgi:hypothetical protein